MASTNFDKPKCDKCHKFTANGGVKCDICESNYHWGCAKAKNLLSRREKLTCCIEDEEGDMPLEQEPSCRMVEGPRTRGLTVDEDEEDEDKRLLTKIAKSVSFIKKNQVTKNTIKELIRDTVQHETADLRLEIADLKREIMAMSQKHNVQEN